MLNENENQYLEFESRPSGSGVTKIISVYSKNRTLLGEIKWFGAWRKYAFFPEYSMIFDNICLEALQKKLEEMMEERKNRV